MNPQPKLRRETRSRWWPYVTELFECSAHHLGSFSHTLNADSIGRVILGWMESHTAIEYG